MYTDNTVAPTRASTQAYFQISLSNFTESYGRMQNVVYISVKGESHKLEGLKVRSGQADGDS